MIGRLSGGRLDGLARIRFHWGALALVALLVQVIQFDRLGGSLVGGAGPAVYVLSTAVVLGVVVRNIRMPGMPVVAVGAASNLAAISANGGYMPSDPGALAFAGMGPADGPTNGIVVADPVLRPLTDVLALPAGFPLANVFSVGDVLIALGVVVAIATAMRRPLAEGGTAAAHPSGPTA